MFALKKQVLRTQGFVYLGIGLPRVFESGVKLSYFSVLIRDVLQCFEHDKQILVIKKVINIKPWHLSINDGIR